VGKFIPLKVGHKIWLISGSLWSAVVIFFSLIASKNLPSIFYSLEDFILHFTAYFFSAFLFAMGSRSSFGPWKPALLCFLIGFTVEIIQPTLLNGRSFSFQDVISNSIGLIFGIILARFLGKRIFTT